MNEPSPHHRPQDPGDVQRLRELTEQAFDFLDQIAECRARNEQLRRELDAVRAELQAVRQELQQARGGEPKNR